MGDTCVPSLIVIRTIINQLETKVSHKTILFQAICCRLQICNVLSLEVMVGDACKLRVVVIRTTIYLVLLLYITNRTLLPEAICCSLQTSTYCCFYHGGKI